MGSETTDELSVTRMRDRQPGFDSTRDRDGERNDWMSGRTAGGDALRDGGDARSSWLVMSRDFLAGVERFEFAADGVLLGRHALELLPQRGERHLLVVRHAGATRARGRVGIRHAKVPGVNF